MSGAVLSTTLQMIGSKEIGLQLKGSVFFPFLWKGFSFATLQASGKTPRDIDKLHISHIGIDKILAASHKNFSESLFLPAALAILIFKIIFKTLFSVVSFK